MSEKQYGTVKWYNKNDGYGFILPDTGGKDVFMHRTKIEESKIPLNKLDEGVPVSYVLRDFKGRPQAEEIALL